MTSSEPVLISPAELAELLGSVQPPVVADVRWTLGGPPGKPDFEACHIPGACLGGLRDAARRTARRRRSSSTSRRCGL